MFRPRDTPLNDIPIDIEPLSTSISTQKQSYDLITNGSVEVIENVRQQRTTSD